MNEEQEGIELETINPDNADEIVLPTTDEEVEDVENTTETTEQDQVESNEDDDISEKELLKKDINKERRKRKEAEKKTRDLEKRIKALEDANKVPEKTTEEELIESGVDETIAKSIADAINKKQQNNSELVQELADLKFNKSLTEKSKEEGFEDILDYAEEIKDFVDKGLSIEQSYYALTYDKNKTLDTKSEIERKVEAKLQNNQARKNILGNYNDNRGAIPNNKSKVVATAEEKGIAAAAGMSVEEYVAFRDMQSVKDYDKYNSAKKK